jgi:hypothetical protein
MQKLGTPVPVGTQQGTPMTALETWMTSNMLWLGIGAAGLLILPNLFSGGRRR